MAENQTQTSGTPTFLKVLCILTFIGSGLVALGMILLLVGAGALLANIPGIGAALGGATVLIIISILLAGANIYGAIQMMGLKKIGFYIYTGAQVLGLILPLIFGAGFSIGALFFSALFVVLYGLNLKHMQ
jgi:hypothetical protein